MITPLQRAQPDGAVSPPLPCREVCAKLVILDFKMGSLFAGVSKPLPLRETEQVSTFMMAFISLVISPLVLHLFLCILRTKVTTIFMRRECLRYGGHLRALSHYLITDKTSLSEKS